MSNANRHKRGSSSKDFGGEVSRVKHEERVREVGPQKQAYLYYSVNIKKLKILEKL